MQQDLFNTLIDKYLSGKAGKEEMRLLEEYYTRLGRNHASRNAAPDAAVGGEIFAALQSRMHGLEPVLPARVRSLANLKVWAAAAIFIVLAGAAVWWLAPRKEIAQPLAKATPAAPAPIFHTIRNDAGRVKDTVLSDGTHVWLNAHAALVAPQTFTGNERMVQLEGEAYFEVVHNAAQPFRVKAGDALIEDIGTRFNVKAEKGKQPIVTLVEGIVAVNGARLSPGQQYQNGRITTVNTAMTTAWVNAIEEDKTIVFTKFPAEADLRLEKIFSCDEEKFHHMFMLNDTTLCLYAVEGTPGGYYFNTYSLNSKKRVGGYIKTTTGQTFSFAGLHRKKTFWAYDFSVDYLVTENVDNRQTSSFQLPFHYYNIQLMDSSKIAGNGAEHTLREMQELDLQTNKEIADYGELEKMPGGGHLTAWKDAHQGFLYLKPSEEKLVLAYRHTDRIRIYDRKTHHSITLKGPENYTPSFTEMFVNGFNRWVMVRTPETRMSFHNGAVTDQYIFLLYSGLQDEQRYVASSKTRSAGQYVFVYDWNGNPVKKIKLDRLVTSITVSDDNQTLYANHNNADAKTIYQVKTGL